MTDSRRRMSLAEFEAAVQRFDPGYWASGDVFIYHREMTDIPKWNVYGSPGFKRLTRAQQVLMCWNDVIGQVENGGLGQLHENFPDAISEILAAVRELGWPELSERFEAAHLVYIAPSKSVPQWLKHRKMNAELEQRRLLKAWRDNIETFEPLPIWLFDFWRSHGHSLYNSDKARKAWRNHYRSKPPDGNMLWVFVAKTGIGARACRGEEEEPFNTWFWSSETKTASVAHIARYIRENRDSLVLIV